MTISEGALHPLAPNAGRPLTEDTLVLDGNIFSDAVLCLKDKAQNMGVRLREEDAVECLLLGLSMEVGFTIESVKEFSGQLVHLTISAEECRHSLNEDFVVGWSYAISAALICCALKLT